MSRRIGVSTILLVASLCLVSGREAQACGGFFSKTTSSEVVAMSDVRVFFVQTPGHVDQYVQVGYSGKAREFAWVYPVPANPEVAEVKDSPFPRLEEQTRPTITIVTPDSSGGDEGCGCPFAVGSDSAKGAGNGRDTVPTVKIWQSGQVGAFDYAVITATRVEDMMDWLSTNSFTIPSKASAVLGHYVTLRWYFVAMKVSVGQTSGEVPATTVIRLGYGAADVIYPLHMLSLSPAQQTSLELYLLSSQQLSPANSFLKVAIDPAELQANSEETHNYDEVFAATLARGGARSLVLEYNRRLMASDASTFVEDALPEGSYVLSRLRTTLLPAVMNGDLQFAPDAAFTEIDPRYELTYRPPEKAGLPAPLSLLLLAALVPLHRLLRRRSQPGQ